MERDIREHYARLQAEVSEVARAAGRAPDEITIVAVTKKQPEQAVRAAIGAGIADIGENYLQEARAKFDALGEPLGARKHFIGHLQTNKAKAVAQVFDVVQSVDRIEAGRALARGAGALGKTVRALVQVNISPTERFGCTPEEAERLAEALRAEQSLLVDGVMAIGPITQDSGEIVRAFEIAAKTFERIGGNTLSIGMSGDWREAVHCGSTMIRIGTSLFGPRPAAPLAGAEK